MLIIYELNEVPRKIFEHFSYISPESSWALFFNKAKKFETIAADVGHLSPWTTWPTVHRGVRDSEHEIKDFGQSLGNVNKEYPPIWELLANNDLNVGLFGSLHSFPVPKNLNGYKFYVPDTFAAGSECFPKKLSIFQEFNLNMAKLNSREVGSNLDKLGAIKLALNSFSLGIKIKTLNDTFKQIVDEKVDSNKTVRRRTFQAKFSFDIFYSQLLKTLPDVSFFFTNHVASSMHRYWPALFPDDYKNLPYGEEWLDNWRDEIPYTVRQTSLHMKALIKLVNDGHEVMIISSMGQAAVQDRIKQDKALILDSPQKLFKALGIPEDIKYSIRPAMVPQYMFEFESDISKYIAKAPKIYSGNQFLSLKILESNILRVEIPVNMSSHKINVEDIYFDISELGMKYVNLRDAAGANAYHIPEGMLLYLDRELLYSSSFDYNISKISTLDLAPSILKKFGILPGSYMKGEEINFKL